MYSLAGNGVGFLNLSPSAHRYSNLGPPDIVGQVCSVQYSEMVPYIKLILLKKSTTAIRKFLMLREFNQNYRKQLFQTLFNQYSYKREVYVTTLGIGYCSPSGTIVVWRYWRVEWEG